MGTEGIGMKCGGKHVLNMCGALGSIPSINKKINEKEKRGGKRKKNE
jgi:hypothetical protein